MSFNIRGFSTGLVLTSIIWVVYGYFAGSRLIMLASISGITIGLLIISSVENVNGDDDECNKTEGDKSEYKYSIEDMSEKYDEEE